LLVYVVMAFVVPEARSPEEKAAASGNPSTAQEFIRRAKEGYYEAMKGFPGPQGASRMEAPVQAGNARERGPVAI
jgi:hypothetical protein